MIEVFIRVSPVLKRALIADKLFTVKCALHLSDGYGAVIVNLDNKQIVR